MVLVALEVGLLAAIVYVSTVFTSLVMFKNRMAETLLGRKCLYIPTLLPPSCEVPRTITLCPHRLVSCLLCVER